MSKKLSEKESRIYYTIKDCVKGAITKNQAREMLGRSEKTILRLIKKYHNEGKQGFSHKLKNISPTNKTTSKKEVALSKYYQSNFAGWNFTHFCDFLRETKPKDAPSFIFELSNSSVRRILNRQGITSPLANRQKKAQNHPSRYRRLTFGELVQIDASIHDWFGDGVKYALYIAIDDATSEILAAYFERTETLHGYFQLFYQILIKYGIPACFYSDNRGGFENRSNKDTLKSNMHFMNACSALGVEMKTTSVPQAKGRVERSFRTHQDRLINEMRHMSVNTLEVANQFLLSYVTRHNIKFAEKSKALSSSFMPIPKNIDINKILCISEERSILDGNVVSYKGSQYMPVDKKGEFVILFVDIKVIAGKAFDESLFIKLDKKYYGTQLIKEGKSTAHKPPTKHPWKQGYGKSLDEQDW